MLALVLFPCLGCLNAATPVVDHDLAVTVSIPHKRIDVVDTITLDRDRAALDLLLHAGMTPTVDGGKAFTIGTSKVDLVGYDGGAILDRPKAILGLRPEHLSIQDHAEPGQTIAAVVEIDEPMGADSLVWLVAEGRQISVRVPVERRPTTGTKVHLKVDISKASIFDEASELRI